MPSQDKSIETLIADSQDLQSDSMRSTKTALDEMVEVGRERRAHRAEDVGENHEFAHRRRQFLGRGLVGAGLASGFGAAILALLDSPAFADNSSDIQMLQTAASIEVLAVATYKTALTLPFIGGSSANPVVKTFAQTTMGQHAQHLQAFNSAAQSLGGGAQNSPDPKYNSVVQQAVPTIKGPGDVVSLALKLENVAAETYVADVGALSDPNAKKLTASIMGVEAQHVSVLLAVQALLTANVPQDISLVPGTAAMLPAAAGSVGFPNSFYPTDMASSAIEGAVK